MENNGFERFANAWKKSTIADSTEKVYAEEDIKKFKMKSSKNFSRTLNNALNFDLVHKSILVLGMVLLIWFYRSDLTLVMTIAGLIGISILLMIRQGEIQKKLKETDNYSKELSNVISEKIKFYKSYFPSIQWMMAFTNGLLVWVGSMFYFYSKYGYYRIDDAVDILVNVLMVSFAVGISYLSYRFQYKFNLTELEENLVTLDDKQAATMQIQNQRARKRRFKIALIILSTVGLLLFLYLLLTYMKQLM